MAAIKITGFDPDQFERPDSEPSSRSVRRTPSPSDDRAKPQAPPREVRKAVDKDTAEHLRIKYGLTNVKYSELAPKKSGKTASMKSGASHRYGGPRLADKPEKAAAEGAPQSAPTTTISSVAAPADPEDASGTDDE